MAAARPRDVTCRKRERDLHRPDVGRAFSTVLLPGRAFPQRHGAIIGAGRPAALLQKARRPDGRESSGLVRAVRCSRTNVDPFGEPNLGGRRRGGTAPGYTEPDSCPLR